MTLSEAFVEIKGRLSPLQKDLAKAQQATNKAVSSMQKTMDKYSASIKKVGKAMSLAGAGIIASLTGAVFATVKLGDAFDKMSLRTGMAVEQLSALSYAAQISGSDNKALETGLRFLARRMSETAEGIGIAKEVFDKLGIAVTETSGKLRGQMPVLLEAAEKIAAMTDETLQVAYAMDIFGARSGPALLPLLKQGSAGIEELTKKAAELGLVISTESAAAAAVFNDRMTDLRESVKMAAYQIGNVLLPALQPLIERLTKSVGQVIKWVKEHPKLTKALVTFAGVIGGLLAVGGPLLMMAPTILGITVAVQKLTAALGTAGLVGALSKVAWLLNPITAAIVIFGTGAALAAKEIARENEAINRQKRALDRLVPALQVYGKELDPTIGDLKEFGVSTRELSKALGRNVEETESAVAVYKELDEKWYANTETLAKLQGKLEDYTKKTEEATTATEDLGETTTYFKDAIKLIFSPLDTFGEKIDELALKAKDLRGALKEVGKFLPELPPTPMPKGIEPRPRFDIVPEEAWLAADVADKAYAKIQESYFELTHTIKELREKEWAAEKKTLEEKGLTEKQIDDARAVFYKDYIEEVERLDREWHDGWLEISRVSADYEQRMLEERARHEGKTEQDILNDRERKNIAALDLERERLNKEWALLEEDYKKKEYSEVKIAELKLAFLKDWFDKQYASGKKWIEASMALALEELEGRNAYYAKMREKDLANQKRMAKEGHAAEERERDKTAQDYKKWLKDQEKAREAAAEKARRIQERFIGDIQRTFSNLFEDMMMDMDSFGDAWKWFCEDLKRVFVRRVAEMAAAAILGKEGAVVPEKTIESHIWDLLKGIVKGVAVAAGTAAIVGTGGTAAPIALPAMAGVMAQKGGIFPGGLEIPKMQAGGIFRRPTLAMIGEGRQAEAVIPMPKGKIPVELKGEVLGGVHIENFNVSFPNANLENMTNDEVQRTLALKILPAIDEARRSGSANLGTVIVG